MINAVTRIFALLLSVIALGVPAFAQETTAKLRGEVVVRAEDGVERVPGAGSVELWIRHRREWQRHEVLLDSGRFAVDVPIGFTWLDAGRIVIEGREAWCKFGLDGEIPASPAKLVARFVKPFTLRVVASGSSRDLTDLEIIEVQGTEGPPSGPRIGTMRANSPFVVPLWRREEYAETDMAHGWHGARKYFVRAPDMVWTSITIDPSEGGSRTLALEPAAGLRVQLAEGKVPSDVVVELRREVHETSGSRIAIAHSGQHVDMEGIAAGTYWVAAELLDRAKRGFPGGQTGRFLFLEQVELAPGVIRELSVRLRDRAEPIDATGRVWTQKTLLRGTLRVPAAWGEPNLSIEFYRDEPSMRRYMLRAGVSHMPRDATDPELLHWNAGQVDAGSWIAVLSPIAWCTAFTVGDGSGEPVSLEMPPPAIVTVRVVDAESGTDIEPCTLAWHSQAPSLMFNVQGAAVDRNVRSKIWQFRAPLGVIRFKLNTYSVYATKLEQASIVPGENEVTLRLSRLHRIRVVAVGGTTPIPAARVRATAHSLDGLDHGVLSGIDGEGAYLQVSRPGTYSVTLEPIEGFEPPSPVQVEVVSGASPRTAVFQLPRADK